MPRLTPIDGYLRAREQVVNARQRLTEDYAARFGQYAQGIIDTDNLTDIKNLNRLLSGIETSDDPRALLEKLVEHVPTLTTLENEDPEEYSETVRYLIKKAGVRNNRANYSNFTSRIQTRVRKGTLTPYDEDEPGDDNTYYDKAEIEALTRDDPSFIAKPKRRR